MLDRFEQWDKEAAPALPSCDFPLRKTWYFYQDKAGRSGEAVPLTPGSRRGLVKLRSLSHHLLFQQQLTSKLFGRICLFCAQGSRRVAALTQVERCIKRLLFNCRMCGDCTLSSSAFLCPQAGCPKRLTNGPCGGSHLGFCEVHPERRCFWVRVYERLDQRTTLQHLAALPHLPPKDWALEHSSFWISFFTKQQRGK
jgi:methylenetetrahydrofolate reductase (NADPH)